MIERFQRVQPTAQAPTSREFVESQLRLERVLGALTTREWNGGVLLEDQVLEAGYENLVVHTLGKVVSGWWLVDQDTLAIVCRYAASTADLSVYLPLQTSADCTVSLVVF